MVGSISLAGVALLTLVAPFELTAPLVRLPWQSVSNLEAAVLCAIVADAAAFAWSRRLPVWRTPLTAPWIALLLAMLVASLASPVSRLNALHMTGRLAAAFAVFLLASNAITSSSRLRSILSLAVGVGVVVSALAILEYRGVRPVLTALRLFRPWAATVGAQIRAGGPLQYPTIASMYLEVVFAVGLGVLLTAFDAGSRARTVVLFCALALIGEAITLTFTRAGLITMATSLFLVGLVRRQRLAADTGSGLLALLAAVIALLFVGSRSAESVWLRMTSEGQESWYRAAISAPPDIDLPTGSMSTVELSVTNSGRLPWDSHASPPTLLSYHWLEPSGDRFVVFEGVRTPFAEPVGPGATTNVLAYVRAPRQPGSYRIEWDLVQEGRLWFSTEPEAVRAISSASVEGDLSDEDITTIAPPRAAVRPGRLVLWRAAVRMFAAHPLTGVGPDNFRLTYGAYAGIADADPRTHSNNMYLELLAGGGLLVGAAFGWLAWRASDCAQDLIRTRPGVDTAALGLAAALLAIAVHASVDSFLSFAPTYVLFSLILGCAVACARGMETWPDAHRL
jgi:hypothetical protein